VVTATLGIVQWYCVVCVIYCGYSNSRYSAMVLCCMLRFCGYSNRNIVQWYCVLLEFILVKATVDIVQWCCVVFGMYCG